MRSGGGALLCDTSGESRRNDDDWKLQFNCNPYQLPAPYVADRLRRTFYYCGLQ